MTYNPFYLAKPVWAKGLQDEMNCNLGFYKEISTNGGKFTLFVATAGHYRLMINGEFDYYGPARTAEGFFRVDEVQIDLPKGVSHIAIWAVNHRARCYGLISQRAFLQAELREGDRVLAATGSNLDFEIFELSHRVKKVPRYGFQRPFSEGYRLCNGYDDWAVGKPCSSALPRECEADQEKTLIKRNLAQNIFAPARPATAVSVGRVEIAPPESYYRFFSLTDAGTVLDGFPMAELEMALSDEAQEFKNSQVFEGDPKLLAGAALGEKEFVIYSLEGEHTGFISMDIECKKAGSLYITFDEILSDGDVDSHRMDCCNVIRLDCEAGHHPFTSMECYGFKYIKLTAKSGEFFIKDLHLKQYICPQPQREVYKSQDPEINKIIDAAKWTFLQNSADMFMDCPTRERAGWLCDSFFLGRSEFEFTGANAVERNYLENYLLRDNYPCVPEGMVPMCYPSDHGPNSFIPNWAMWLVIELEEYAERSGDKEFVDGFKSKIYGLLEWFKKYENADGLLEKLPGWVFVEWSMANSFTKDLNFPSNMLYARMLESASRLYDDESLCDKASALKEVIRKRSFDGEFFRDNEVFENGVLVSTTNRTETCQYYAFFTGVATPALYPNLWHTLITDFGPQRKEKGLYPEIHPSNAFIGNYLRLMLLLEQGLCDQLLDESKGYFLYMAERTGTLWEFISTEASCNHGFASYAACLIREAEQKSTKK